MVTELFGIDIAGLVHQHISPGLLDATLIRRVAGARNPARPSAGVTVTDTPYACKAVIENKSQGRINNTRIRKGDRVVLVTGDSLPDGIVPQDGDDFIIEGQRGQITGVPERDSAAAAFTFITRP